ncbi:hypothetical protein BJ138DRAFT_1146350 [Hygrophoropsis aurantiaca]|uniref:Uncharacterized protein n=1 Tax=Hygrophoropsis aurantiaca TaxID=72124 RepID=A0ACB8AJA8_9AGAM|nr:hypothetical protein BJ138DRAFT_1146350 [Hygrophoropsis aurantiaca]
MSGFTYLKIKGKASSAFLAMNYPSPYGSFYNSRLSEAKTQDCNQSIASLRNQIDQLKEQISLLTLQCTVVNQRRCLLKQQQLVQPLVLGEKLYAHRHQMKYDSGLFLKNGPKYERTGILSAPALSMDSPVLSRKLRNDVWDAGFAGERPSFKNDPFTSPSSMDSQILRLKVHDGARDSGFASDFCQSSSADPFFSAPRADSQVAAPQLPNRDRELLNDEDYVQRPPSFMVRF